MIAITVKSVDSCGKAVYRKFQRKEDRIINLKDIERLTNFIYEELREHKVPRIKGTIAFNRYVGVVSGIDGGWRTITSKERAQEVIEGVVKSINMKIINNAEQLGGYNR